MIAAALLLASALAGRDSLERPVVRAERLAGGEAIVLDGRLDESAWARAGAAGRFVQFSPDPGKPSKFESEARIVYDQGAIYVGMRLRAPRALITRQLVRRDANMVFSDWAMVQFDSYLDRRTAFEFAVNPANVQRDAYRFSDDERDFGWNAVWTSATRIDDEGWTVEMRIPLSQLRYKSIPASEARSWGINFERYVAQRSERSTWSGVLPTSPGFVSRFGTLEGLTDLPAPQLLELQPYAVSRLTQAPLVAGNPLVAPNQAFATMGADFKYGVTSDFTLTGTINPDFGQVEADPAFVNLTAFEFFLPEQRPFFLEGQDLFTFGLAEQSLFYSRRIGRRPRGPLPGGTQFSEVPQATRILGAAKLSGKTPSGWSVGALTSVTGTEMARFVDGSQAVRETSVEPGAIHSVARVLKDFREGQSALGAFATGTVRVGASTAFPTIITDAFTVGADLRHRFGGGLFEFRAKAIGSLVEGPAPSILALQRSNIRLYQRPGQSYLRVDSLATSLGGMGGELEIEKIGGRNWYGYVYLGALTPGLELNPMGFQTRADRLFNFQSVGYREPNPKGPFNRWSAEVEHFNILTTGGEYLQSGLELSGDYEFRSFWRGNYRVFRSFAGRSTDQLRGGPSVRMPGHWQVEGRIDSDRRKPLRFGLGFVHWREDASGGRRWEVAPSVSARPTGSLDFSVGSRITFNDDAWQYVTQQSAPRSPVPGTAYVMGDLRQRTVSVTARANYIVSPTLSFQLFSQAFVSGGTYQGFRQVVAPDAAAFADRFAPFDRGALAGNPDFSRKQFNVNAVARWEYRPGSTLFIVWTQARNGALNDGSFDVWRDAGRLFQTPGTDVFLVKLSYWLGV
ncbi:MAG: DUF5916 domain-containing protein [Gemmatimonadales bacterium]|nr:DUF5916 domain-containing protein [Gemmatimonadales bacterium]